MGMNFVRALFALAVVAIGVLGYPKGIPGLVAGVLLASAVIALEVKLHSIKANVLMGGVVGTSMGLVLAIGFGVVARGLDLDATTEGVMQGVALLLFAYLGMAIGALKGDKGEWWLPWKHWREDPIALAPDKVLDTSVIIDGRIAGIAEAGFLEGRIVVPQFVLAELQEVADATDATKRARGRRGLETLRQLQQQPRLEVEIDAADYPKLAQVDMKLVELADERKGRLLTNDANLASIAVLRGVEVANMHALAAALKPAFVPGESLVVTIVKDGKEPGQGVGYLDDGTMVVVDAASRDRGQEVQVAVTSVIQTNAGKMVFARKNGESADRQSHQEPALTR
jgi:uncharacterized protein YacL